MADTWTGTVLYADADQALLRVVGTPPLQPGETLVIAREGAPQQPGAMSPYRSTTGVGGATLVDNQGATWALASDRRVLRNGTAVPSSSADLLLWFDDNRMYATTTNNGRWYGAKPDASGFIPVPGDPRVSTTPVPTPTPTPTPGGMSPYGSETGIGEAPLTDDKAVTWALQAPAGRVLRNGAPMNAWSAAARLYWHRGNRLYARTADDHWWVARADGSDFDYIGPTDPRVDTPPTPVPTPTPIPPPSGGVRERRGGWIFPIEWAGARIAINHETREIYVSGHDQQDDIHVCDLPAQMGTGAPSTWPHLVVKKTIPKWWVAIENIGPMYANGLAFFRGKVWAAPKVAYATGPGQFDGLLILSSPDGDRIDVPLNRQRFSGFVKRAGKEPLIGAGGYASGQGSCSGPSLGTMDGQRLIEYGWPAKPGPNMEFWNDRAPREPNYWSEGHGDEWIGWEPRTINGVRQGRWASDMICGGGLFLPDGIKYWPLMGIGELKYGYQSYGFAAEGNVRTYEYTYPVAVLDQPGDYRQSPSFQMVGMGLVLGQEVAPDGTVYLSERWIAGGNFAAISVWT